MVGLMLYAKSETDLNFLVQTVRVFCKDLGMQFRLNKCVVLFMKRGRKVNIGDV